jgi:tRNA (guanine-N7-)-methyltransferase
MARLLKDYLCVSLRPEDLDDKIDFLKVFGRPGPVHIEIGTGKAAFLLNQAKAQPQTNFLGIEWARRYYRFAVDRMGRWQITNVRIIRTDAAHFIANFVPDNCVDCFHVYFPDPWPKKRHHKRRFFNPENLHHLLRCLKFGGLIKVATDHNEYFQKIKRLLNSQPDKLAETDFFPSADADPDEWVGTNFERKYRKENRPIYVIAARKK